MELINLVLIGGKFEFGAPDDTKVGGGFLVDTDWDLKFYKLCEVAWVFHFLEDDAFLHLTDVLLHDNLIQLLKLFRYFVSIEGLLLLLELILDKRPAFLQELLPAFF
jgi:hypothetical protein